MLGQLLDIQTQNDDVLFVRGSRSLALLLLILIGFSLVLASVTPIVSGNLIGLISSGVALLLFTVVFLINGLRITTYGRIYNLKSAIYN